MGQKLYRWDADGIIVKPGRKSWGVDIPAHVYDVWMHIITYKGVFIYGLLWRLAIDGSTKKASLKKLAGAAGIGDKTLVKYIERLERCGFLQVIEPDSYKKSMHFTNEYIILDPPTEIPQALIDEFFPNGDYKPLATWLIETPDEDVESASSNDDAASSNNDVTASNNDAKIDPSGIGPSGLKTNAGRPQGGHPALTGSGRRISPNRNAVTTNRDTSEKKKKSPADPDFPAIGRLVIDVLARNNVPTRNLTINQIALLSEAVALPRVAELQPSPQQEYEVHPQRFKAFVDQLEEMPWLQKQPSITAGTVIKAVRSYHFNRGWYNFHPDARKRNEAEVDLKQNTPVNMTAFEKLLYYGEEAE